MTRLIFVTFLIVAQCIQPLEARPASQNHQMRKYHIPGFPKIPLMKGLKLTGAEDDYATDVLTTHSVEAEASGNLFEQDIELFYYDIFLKLGWDHLDQNSYRKDYAQIDIEFLNNHGMLYVTFRLKNLDGA